jgi:hypothetical protein
MGITISAIDAEIMFGMAYAGRCCSAVTLIDLLEEVNERRGPM